MTLLAADRAPSKTTSVNTAEPVIWRIGRISTPGWRIGTRMYESPLCFAASGSVRQMTKLQSACWASDVQVF